MKFVAVCTPTLGMVTIEWASALRALLLPLNSGYCECFGKDDVGGEIAEGRNGCVARALSYETDDREITHLFWLDDDVIAPRTAIIRLMSHDVDIAAGVYFLKCPISEPLIFPGRGAGTSPFVPDQVFETWGVGMGITLVKTSVYRRMREDLELPLDKYGKPQWYKTPSALDAVVVDEVLFAGGTEDLYFCDRAGKMGCKVVADTSRYAFGWHYDCRNGIGYPEKQWRQHMAGEAITWDTPGGVVTWGGPVKPVVRPPATLVADETPHAVLADGPAP